MLKRDFFKNIFVKDSQSATSVMKPVLLPTLLLAFFFTINASITQHAYYHNTTSLQERVVKLVAKEWPVVLGFFFWLLVCTIFFYPRNGFQASIVDDPLLDLDSKSEPLTIDFAAIQAIIGLGNPTKEYFPANGRHNIGFMILNALAEKYKCTWSLKENMKITNIQTNQNTTITLVKPQTGMNDSGNIFLLDTFKSFKPANVLIIYDNMNFDLGTFQLSVHQGWCGGHKGVLSIANNLGKGFGKLSFGIGRPENGNDQIFYVLSEFTKEQRNELDSTHIPKVIKSLETSLGFQAPAPLPPVHRASIPLTPSLKKFAWHLELQRKDV